MLDCFVSGHDFSHAANRPPILKNKQRGKAALLLTNLPVLKGHDFTRADKSQKKSLPLGNV